MLSGSRLASDRTHKKAEEARGQDQVQEVAGQECQECQEPVSQQCCQNMSESYPGVFTSCYRHSGFVKRRRHKTNTVISKLSRPLCMLSTATN